MIRRINPKKIPKDCTIKDDNIYDTEGNLIGPVPYKEYESDEEYLHDLLRGDEERLDPILWSEFNEEVFPEEKWTVKHLIPNEGLVILASPSGEKKTWIAMSMASAVASGEDFLGNEEFKTQKGAVLYIDQEMPKPEFQRRGRQLCLPEEGKNFWLWNRDKEINFNNEETRKEFYTFIEEKNIKAIFIDTLRAVAGGLKEDKAEDVRKFFNHFKPLKNKGVVMIILDHCRKPHQFERRTPKKEQLFASQDKLASVEGLLMIKSQERSGDISIYHLKNRSSVEYKPFAIRIEDQKNEDGSIKTILSYSGTFEERESKKDEAKKFILIALADGGKTRKELLHLTLKEKQTGGKNTSDAIRELATEGSIITQKQGRENLYSLPIIPEETILAQGGIENSSLF